MQTAVAVRCLMNTGHFAAFSLFRRSGSAALRSARSWWLRPCAPDRRSTRDTDRWDRSGRDGCGRRTRDPDPTCRAAWDTAARQDRPQGGSRGRRRWPRAPRPRRYGARSARRRRWSGCAAPVKLANFVNSFDFKSNL